MSYNPNLIDTGEAAKIIGVSVKTLIAWRYKKSGPRFYRISHKCIRYSSDDLRTFIESRISLAGE